MLIISCMICQSVWRHVGHQSIAIYWIIDIQRETVFSQIITCEDYVVSWRGIFKLLSTNCYERLATYVANANFFSIKWHISKLSSSSIIFEQIQHSHTIETYMFNNVICLESDSESFHVRSETNIYS